MKVGREGGAVKARSQGRAAGEDLVQAPTEVDISLLWSAASSRPDLETVSRAAGDADIPSVLEAASYQRVAPLVLRSLAAAGVLVDPASPFAGQGRAWEAHAHLALAASARTALEPLREAGFEPLLLKGLGLIERYPSPGLRPMDDIDILLPKIARGDAAWTLEQAGWHRARHLGVHDPGYDLVFSHPSVPGVPLELHYDFAEWRERPRALAGESLWAARVPTTVFGLEAWTLPPELELVALIAHAAKWFHLFNRLLWMVDLEVVINTSVIDWDEVARLAAAARRRVATAIALRMARRLGAEVPEELLKLPRLLAVSRTVAHILDPAAPFDHENGPRWSVYLMLDGLSEKMRFAAGDLAQPPPGQTRGEVVSELAGILARGAAAVVRAARPGSAGRL